MHSAERLHSTIEICGGLTQETTLHFHPFAWMGLLEAFLSLFGTLKTCSYKGIMSGSESIGNNTQKKAYKNRYQFRNYVSMVLCGKKNLNKAIAASKDHYDFEIRWHPFQLNPSAPKEGINRKEYYRNKFGSQTKRIEARMSEVFRGHGLEYNLSGLTGNTLDSHRLMHFAGQQGLHKQHNLMEVLSLGYFTQAKFISDKLIAAHSLSIARYSPPPQSLPFINATTKAYISDTSNECSSNLSSEQGGDSTKFQKVDVQSNVQLTPTSMLKENKRTYLVTITK